MSILAPNSHILYRATTQHRDQYLQLKISGSCLVFVKSYGIRFDDGKGGWKKIVKIRELKAKGFWPDMSRPSMVEMEYVTNSEHLDQILAKASELDQAIIIDWMAAWCRKCIYLKPKLEKLAAEYDAKVKFYCVDVNNVPQALVKRGGISKMPTIQLWKDGEVKAEVIGGHKAWIVIEEVREMIQKFL